MASSGATPAITKEEFGTIASALRLAIASCDRLSKRVGTSPAASAAYRQDAEATRKLLAKVEALS